MTTTMLLLVSCAVGLGCAMQAPRSSKSSSDLREICQRILDASALDKYFHVDTRPERKPLVVLKNDVLSEEIALTKFGTGVKYATREELQTGSRPYFEFRQVTITGDEANVDFAYPPEGIRGTAKLNRQPAGWTVTNVKLVER